MVQAERIRPEDKPVIGGINVRNKTANSILVRLAEDGCLEVVDCCLEEQGK